MGDLTGSVSLLVGNVDVSPPMKDKSDGLGEVPAEVTLSDRGTEGREPVGITNWERLPYGDGLLITVAPTGAPPLAPAGDIHNDGGTEGKPT